MDAAPDPEQFGFGTEPHKLPEPDAWSAGRTDSMDQ
jgi:hypothetical protein